MSTNEAGWFHHCQQLWSQKLHVSPEAKLLVAANNLSPCPAREAYIASCMDALRNDITDDELCYDSQGTIWSFRFKESAGEAWTTFDPWYTGEEPRRMIFLRDGRVFQIADNDELQLPFSDAVDARGLEVRWRKVTTPLIDGETRSDAVYIRLQVAGRDIPTYVVRRHRSNWGFLLENCWGIFASFQLPRKQRFAAPSRYPNNAELSTRPTKRLKLNEDVDLLSDSTLAVTSRLQWREALLYNLGTIDLPDGPDAVAIFNQAWQAADLGVHLG
jgi:hypothetical protein